MSATKLLRLSVEDAAMMVFLVSAGIEFCSSPADKENGTVTIKLSASFSELANVVLPMANFRTPLEMVNYYNRVVGPLTKWLDEQSAIAGSHSTKHGETE